MHFASLHILLNFYLSSSFQQSSLFLRSLQQNVVLIMISVHTCLMFVLPFQVKSLERENFFTLTYALCYASVCYSQQLLQQI